MKLVCLLAALLLVVDAWSSPSIEPEQKLDSKAVRRLLINDFEDGSLYPWADQSTGDVRWVVEDVDKQSEPSNSTVPTSLTGKKYARAIRNNDLQSGLAVLRTPAFTALPGDKITFSFWIQSNTRPYSNNLELVYVVGARDETILTSLSQYSIVDNKAWSKQSVVINVPEPTELRLVFYGSIGYGDKDGIAIDDIILESEDAPGTTAIPVSTTITPTCSSNHGGTGDSILSPNFPGNYVADNLDCRHNILVSGGFRIFLTFSQISIETNKDYIQVYDGPNTDYPTLLKFTGVSTESIQINSTSNTMLLRFTTSNEQYENKGWVASYYTAV